MEEYTVSTEPDHERVGKVVDDEVRKYFSGMTIVARGISSSQHPDKTIQELTEIIASTGTDKYDPNRVGDRYENLQQKKIDIFGFWRKITPGMQLFKHISWGFYHGAKKFTVNLSL